MKPFNLEEALSGKPVRLRNGYKSFVGLNLRSLEGNPELETKYPLIGIYISGTSVYQLAWTPKGHYWNDESEDNLDIIGMWEEPKDNKVAEQALFNFTDSVLEKALKEGLKVYSDKYPSCTYIVIAKSNYSYILKNIKLGGIREETFNDLEHKRISYKLSDSLTLMNEETITVTLPRPFTPEIGQLFYCIESNEDNADLRVVSTFYRGFEKGYKPQAGNYFKTEEDAQAWINALKSAQK